MSYVTLEPINTDYATNKAVKEAWQSNRDFRIADYFHPEHGRAINRVQAVETQDTYTVRFYKARKTVTVA